MGNQVKFGDYQFGEQLPGFFHTYSLAPRPIKLAQLPNGDWIDPCIVTAIKVHPAMVGTSGEVNLPRVSIHYGPANIQTLECSSPAEAAKLRDELAALVNGVPHLGMAPGAKA